MSWDPAQYRKFADERLRPARDLLARVPLAAPRTICDLGCGDGRATRLLAGRWPEAAITGVDGDPAMLAAARSSGAEADWVAADLAAWAPSAPADLVFSNAALHWLDDHASLFPRLLGHVAAGGAFAVQMPRNHDAPSHRAMREAAAQGPWRGRLAAVARRVPVAAPADYYGLLAPLARTVEVWETEYLHALEGDDPVVEWTRGTGLRPFLDALDADERGAFIADYRARVAAAYPRRADGVTPFAFRRLFIVAVR